MTNPSEYCLSSSAERDLRNVWIYTFETWGEEQADRYTQGLKNCCEKVVKNPSLGKLVNEIGAGLRVSHCQHHHLFYLTANKRIIIVGILHEKMDLIQRLQERIRDSRS